MRLRSPLAMVLVVVLTIPVLSPVSVWASGPCGSQVARIAANQTPVAGSTPVLFVHGMASDPGRWSSARMRKSLTDTPAVTAWTFDYAKFSVEWVTRKEIGPSLAEAIGCLARVSGRRVVVVAHSLGGLATQYAVSQRDSDGLLVGDHVAEVVTVATPFLGSKALDLEQKRRGGLKVLPNPAMIATDLFLSLCAATAKKRHNRCAFVSALKAPVGQALREGSSRLKALPKWPADLPVLPIGGDLQIPIGIPFWKRTTIAKQSIGDPVVAMESSTAHAVKEKPIKHRCAGMKAVTIFTSPCSHFELPARPDVETAIVKIVKKAVAAVDGTFSYTTTDPTTGRSILYAWPVGRQPRELTPGVGYAVSVSPDGEHLAWTDTGSGSPFGPGAESSARLVISDIDGSRRREIANGANIGGLCNHPAWSPDSRHVLFQQTPTTATGDAQWVKVDSVTGEKTALRSARSACDPVWSPDGTAIAWQTNNDQPTRSTILITDATGGGGRHIPYINGVKDPCFNALAALSPGGKRAVVDASTQDGRACGSGPGRGGAFAAMVVDTATGKQVPTTLNAPIQNAFFRPDGSLLVQTVGSAEFVLLDSALRITGRFPAGPLGDKGSPIAYRSY